MSKKFTLNRADITYIWERAKLFLFPLLLIYILGVVPKIQADGCQLKDFGLNDFELGALVLYVLNRITTALQLFVKGK